MKKEKIDKKLLSKNLKRMWQYMKTAKKELIIYIILMIVRTLTGVILPLITAKQILYLSNSLFTELLLTAVLILVINLVDSIIGYYQDLAYNKIDNIVTSKVQIDYAREFLKLEIKEIDKSSTGTFAAAINGDAGTMSYVFFNLTSTFSNILGKVGTLVTIFILNKVIFFYFLLISVITLLIGRARNKIFEAHWEKMHEYNEEKYSLINELVRGIRDIKVLNAIDNVMNKTESSIKKVASESLENNKTSSKFWIFQGLVSNVSDIFFFIIGIVLCTNSLMTASTFLILYNYRGHVSNFFSGLNRISSTLKEFNLSASKVFSVIYAEGYQKEIFGTKKLKKATGHIEFKDVCFSYDTKKEVLKNLSFEIKPNETIGFVGKSGAGKSTIFNLITRLYPVTSGNILFDGIDINELDENSIRGNLSIITQSPYIFNFSVKENLLLAKPNATFKEIRKACKLACIDDYFMSLENGYDTLLGEGGLVLSGGQKQRLAIARALLLNTKILLFDEATSALDNETQSMIQESIHNLKGDYTILIIAHRLSTVINSDRIMVIDKGKLVGSGTHKELMKNNKEYQKLYKKEVD